jgi:protein phosphatase
MRDSVQVDVKQYQIEDGDTLLLCCDGVSGMIDDIALGRIVFENGGNVEHAVGDLVDTANKNGGVDNITAILLRCEVN